MTSPSQINRAIRACREAGLPVVAPDDCTCGLRGRIVVVAHPRGLQVLWPYERRCPVHPARRGGAAASSRQDAMGTRGLPVVSERLSHAAHRGIVVSVDRQISVTPHAAIPRARAALH